MNQDVRRVTGMVAGILLLIAAGAYFFSGNNNSGDNLPVITDQEAAIPTYQEYDEPEEAQPEDWDEQGDDVTRIIFEQGLREGDVSVDEVLTGKVVIDGEVVGQESSAEDL